MMRPPPLSLGACLAMAVSAGLFASSVLAAPLLPKPLKELQTVLAKSNTMRAKITQTYKSKYSKTAHISKGYIFIKKPEKFIFQINTPDPSVYTSNGKKARLLMPDMMPQPINDEGSPPNAKGKVAATVPMIGHDVPAQQFRWLKELLNAEFDKVKNVEYLEKASDLVEMRPTGGNLPFSRILIYFGNSKGKKLITKLVVEGKDHSTRIVELNEIALGEPIKDEDFDKNL